MQPLIPIKKTILIDVSAFDFIDSLVARPVSRKVDTNVATLVTDRAHNRSVGDDVLITGVGGTGYNGYFTISAVPTPTSFSYALTHANEGPVVDTDGVINLVNTDNPGQFLIRSSGAAGNIRYSLLGSARAESVTRSVTTNVATIRTKKPHGLLKGNTIMNAGFTDTAYNGPFTVTTCPSPYHFSFALIHANEGETTDTGGVIDDTVIKAVLPQVYFQDPEVCRKVFKDATTAVGVIIGFVDKP